jgi:hypothetical protein
MIITFTDDEMEQIHRLAMIRHKSAGVAVPPKFSKLDAYGIDLLGAMGEAAVSKHFQWAVSTMLFSNIDDGIDFKSPVGNIQVKTANSEYQKTFYQQKEAFPADFGIYARRTAENTIELVGWFYKETWDKFHEAKETDGRVSYMLSADYMNRNFKELLD